jgi:hypothetical protein
MSRTPKIEANRLNPIESSRALKRLRILRAEVEQIYWDTLVELMSLPPNPRNASSATSQPFESKRKTP